MKTCAICFLPNDLDTVVCRACGEASWSQDDGAQVDVPTTRRAPVKPVPDDSAARRAVKEIRDRRGARDSS